MTSRTDDLRIANIQALSSPRQVMANSPASEAAIQTVATVRASLQRILRGRDDRLAVIIGPCSIHDVPAALDYAARLQKERVRLANDLEIVMRVYFEKPRTTVGWKGLINDPRLDGSFAINDGLRIARRLLCDINDMGLPTGCEFLDVITPQYIGDLVSWGAIGARTTESQIHREMASGLSCPVGFKNGTNGDLKIAVDAIIAARRPHHFLAVTKEGQSAIATTTGNEDCHMVLRGGEMPNHGPDGVRAASHLLDKAGLTSRILIDASHANSGKNSDNQPRVVQVIAVQVANGDARIVGVMIESNLLAGREDLVPGRSPTYGRSITDGCIDWEKSITVLNELAEAVRIRRMHRAGAAA